MLWRQPKVPNPSVPDIVAHGSWSLHGPPSSVHAIHPFEWALFIPLNAASREQVRRRCPMHVIRGPTCRKEPRYNAFVLFLSLAVTLFLQVPPLVGVAMQTAAPQTPAPLEPAPGNGVVVISTSLGDVTVELFNDKAPVSVANFLSYATEGFYSGTIFHRVVSGFVVQGGGYTADHGGEAHAPADPERSHQRAAEPPRDGRHGAHPEPAERDLAVLLQRVQQPGSRSPGILPARLRLRRLRPRALGDGRRRPDLARSDPCHPPAWTTFRSSPSRSRASRSFAERRGLTRVASAARHLPDDLRQPRRLRDHHPAAAVLRRDVRRVAARHRPAVRLVFVESAGGRADPRRSLGPYRAAADPALQPARHGRQLRDAGPGSQPGDAVRRADRRWPVGRKYHDRAGLHRRHHAPRRTAPSRSACSAPPSGSASSSDPALGARSRTSATPRPSGPPRRSRSWPRRSRGCGCRRRSTTLARVAAHRGRRSGNWAAARASASSSLSISCTGRRSRSTRRPSRCSARGDSVSTPRIPVTC